VVQVTFEILSLNFTISNEENSKKRRSADLVPRLRLEMEVFAVRMRSIITRANIVGGIFFSIS